eukprot:6478960-Prymnesium_polylepis.1
MAPDADGFINPDNMRPLSSGCRPEYWDAIGLHERRRYAVAWAAAAQPHACGGSDSRAPSPGA